MFSVRFWFVFLAAALKPRKPYLQRFYLWKSVFLEDRWFPGSFSKWGFTALSLCARFNRVTETSFSAYRLGLSKHAC